MVVFTLYDVQRIIYPLTYVVKCAVMCRRVGVVYDIFITLQ